MSDEGTSGEPSHSGLSDSAPDEAPSSAEVADWRAACRRICTSGSFLPEIGEAVNRIKELVLSGQMPSYEAALQYEIDKMKG